MARAKKKPRRAPRRTLTERLAMMNRLSAGVAPVASARHGDPTATHHPDASEYGAQLAPPVTPEPSLRETFLRAQVEAGDQRRCELDHLVHAVHEAGDAARLAVVAVLYRQRYAPEGEDPRVVTLLDRLLSPVGF